MSPRTDGGGVCRHSKQAHRLQAPASKARSGSAVQPKRQLSADAWADEAREGAGQAPEAVNLAAGAKSSGEGDAQEQ